MIKTILIVLFFSISASSQEIDLPNKIPGVNYNSSVSLPQEILGHKSDLLKPFRYNRYAKGELHPTSNSPFPWR